MSGQFEWTLIGGIKKVDSMVGGDREDRYTKTKQSKAKEDDGLWRGVWSLRSACSVCVLSRVQVRDEYRTSFDSGRGGYGKLVQAEIDALMQDGAIPQAQADDHDHRSEVGMRREREESSMDPSVMKPSKVAKASYDSGPSSLAQNPKFRGEGNEDE